VLFFTRIVSRLEIFLRTPNPSVKDVPPAEKAAPM